LRDPDKTNMFGVRPHVFYMLYCLVTLLMKQFPELTQDESNKVLVEWMDSFKKD